MILGNNKLYVAAGWSIVTVHPAVEVLTVKPASRVTVIATEADSFLTTTVCQASAVNPEKSQVPVHGGSMVRSYNEFDDLNSAAIVE
jgi:hypothetical protein